MVTRSTAGGEGRTVRAAAARIRARIAAAVLALGVALGAALPAAAAWEAGSDGLLPIPPLAARVTDLTQTLSAGEQQALEAKLAAFEQKTGAQFVVLLVPTTQPEPIETYSIRVAEAWKIGRKGQDNGIVFLIAKNDRKLRFEVGYGLEGLLTDVTARRIIGDTVAPFFRQGQFAAGINAGVDRVIGIVASGEPAPAAAPAARGQRAGKPIGQLFDTLLPVLFVVVPLAGFVLSKLFGKALGAGLGAGITGVAAFFFAGSLLIAIIVFVVAFVVILGSGAGLVGGIGRGGGFGGGGGGFGGGGGGFSGGGGGFGGGGASGNW
jgi:uncharacterized protein